MTNTPPVAQGYHVDFALHTLGWKAFQDLCAQVCEESFGRTVSIYREAQDDGQDAMFLMPMGDECVEATIQCKFSSKVERRLKVSDITAELDNVRKLVAEGRADTYYLITSLGVDNSVSAAIRTQLVANGVKEPYVLGREWITGEIKSSPRLRALVPRVYGLGDLTAIVDERSAAQTRALLGHLLPGLRVYVPTSAHRTAVRTLASHKLVLLLGPPATGKSMLAAILATMANDLNQLECFKCEGPFDMRSRWNPNEPNRLFWIDDAFGPNQLREDYVDAWIEFMPKMKAAIDQGNHFILTSRTHIWNEANYKLGTRNHPLLANGRAVANVGELSPEERQQILYNHVKEGQQPKPWKTLIKPHLQPLTEQAGLLPEIARRLGDPNYTSGIKAIPADLIRFVREPHEFLKGTIRELVVAQQAAMTLVFLARSRLPLHNVASEECTLVAEKYGTSVSAITQAVSQLEGAFLVRREDAGEVYWGFTHPTFADAITSILSSRPDLVELYLRGAKVETLLGETVCEGAVQVKDAVIVPIPSVETLIGRLLETPDEKTANESLFQFLNRRATRAVTERVLQLAPSLLDRKGSPSPWLTIDRHALVVLRATAFSLNLLSEELRQETCQSLEDAALFSFDVAFISEDDLLAMFRPHELIRLTIKLVDMLENVLPDKIAELEQDADADRDIDDQFEGVSSFVGNMQSLANDSARINNLLSDLEDMIRRAKCEVESRKSIEETESFFASVPAAANLREETSRSIFSDIDE